MYLSCAVFAIVFSWICYGELSGYMIAAAGAVYVLTLTVCMYAMLLFERKERENGNK